MFLDPNFQLGIISTNKKQLYIFKDIYYFSNSTAIAGTIWYKGFEALFFPVSHKNSMRQINLRHS